MSLFGTAEGNTLKGKINRLTELRGYSAYEIALIHGFRGTEEDWLESLVGGGAISFNGRTGYVLPQTGDYTAEMVGARPDNWMPSYSDVGADKAGAAKAVSEALTEQINTNTQTKITTVSISFPAANWTESDVGYSQTVTIEGGNENTLVSLQPSAGQMYLMMEDGVAAIMVNNLNGAFVASVVGEAPTTDMTIQATLTEVV